MNRVFHNAPRRGVVLVMTAISMILIIGFIALSVDIGTISLTQSRMQTAVDSASLAAAQEVTQAVANAGTNGLSGGDAATAAAESARTKAVEIAAKNGVYLDPERDVIFGRRIFDEASGSWSITWGETPYNAVRVVAHRDGSDTSQPDGRLPLAFAWVFGRYSQDLLVQATSYVKPREIALVLDYSGSMNDDSTFNAFGSLGQSAVEANMLNIYNTLTTPGMGTMPAATQFLTVDGQAASGTIPHISVTFGADAGTGKNYVDVTSTSNLTNVILRFDNGSEYMHSGLSGTSGKFYPNSSNSSRRIDRAWVKSGTNSTTAPGTGYSSSNYGERFMDDTATIKSVFGLSGTYGPYSVNWDTWFSYVKSDSQCKSAGYTKKYGGLTFANYLLTNRAKYSQTPDLWKTPHYPTHALKLGTTQFCNFVDDLNYNDRLGLVIYAQTARIEKDNTGTSNGTAVSLGTDWLTYNISAINTIQSQKQASHYDNTTAIGLGLKEAHSLFDQKARVNAKKVVVLMTDGLANVYPSGWSLPGGFDWTSMTDLDNDGDSDYSTSNKAVQYTLYEAKQLIDDDVIIHTLCVGSGADITPMQAIANASGGICVVVPGGTSIAQMEADLLGAFNEIAGKLSPPELTNDQ
ncbi:MAG: pilus assembly protein TadG-related protein [Pirellulales bacterium]